MAAFKQYPDQIPLLNGTLMKSAQLMESSGQSLNLQNDDNLYFNLKDNSPYSTAMRNVEARVTADVDRSPAIKDLLAKQKWDRGDREQYEQELTSIVAKESIKEPLFSYYRTNESGSAGQLSPIDGKQIKNQTNLSELSLDDRYDCHDMTPTLAMLTQHQEDLLLPAHSDSNDSYKQRAQYFACDGLHDIAGARSGGHAYVVSSATGNVMESTNSADSVYGRSTNANNTMDNVIAGYPSTVRLSKDGDISHYNTGFGGTERDVVLLKQRMDLINTGQFDKLVPYRSNTPYTEAMAYDELQMRLSNNAALSDSEKKLVATPGISKAELDVLDKKHPTPIDPADRLRPDIAVAPPPPAPNSPEADIEASWKKLNGKLPISNDDLKHFTAVAKNNGITTVFEDGKNSAPTMINQNNDTFVVTTNGKITVFDRNQAKPIIETNADTHTITVHSHDKDMVFNIRNPEKKLDANGVESLVYTNSKHQTLIQQTGDTKATVIDSHGTKTVIGDIKGSYIKSGDQTLIMRNGEGAFVESNGTQQDITNIPSYSLVIDHKQNQATLYTMDDSGVDFANSTSAPIAPAAGKSSKIQR